MKGFKLRHKPLVWTLNREASERDEPRNPRRRENSCELERRLERARRLAAIRFPPEEERKDII